ncbi:hypothetical protein [Phocaeicola sp.]
MKRINIKSIRALLAIGMLLAGNALWSGCGNDETLTDKTPDTEIPSPKKTGFTFQLSGMGSNARAITDAATEAEKEIKTLYVAFFYKDEADDAQSRLENIYVYDTDVTSGDGFPEKRKITQADGSYTISKPGTVGNYLAYFIANPDDGLKTELATYQATVTGDTPTTLGTFESELVTGSTSGSLTTTNGLIMVSSKESIEIKESNGAAKEIKMTRLAARFDFINTQPDFVTITNVKFVNEPVKSVLIPQETETSDTYLSSNESAKNWPETEEGSNTMTVYTYENLNSNTGENMNYTAIDIAYSIDLDGADKGNAAVNKTLRIDLKEQNVPLAVLRNHLYRIYLNCVTGIYAVSVEDWTSSTTVTIPNASLAITYTETDLGKIGDYVYSNDGKLEFSDGGLRKMYLDGSLEWIWNQTNADRPSPDENKGTCIGVVISNDVSEKDRAAGFTHGYVMSAKASTESYAFKTAEADGTVKDDNVEITRISKVVDAFADMDGYTHCEKIKDQGTHPALAACQDGSVVPQTPKSGNLKPSEWYLPSVGMVYQMIKNFGGTFSNYNNTTTYINEKNYALLGNSADMAPKINKMIEKIDGYTQFLGYTGSITSLLSSTPVAKTGYITSIHFNHGGTLFGSNGAFGINSGSPLTSALPIRPFFVW